MSDMSPKNARASNGQRLSRRFDYPEPLYIPRRTPGPIGSPPVSPRTQDPVLLLAQPPATQPRPPLSSVYSREVDEYKDGGHVTAPSRPPNDTVFNSNNVPPERAPIVRRTNPDEQVRDSGLRVHFEAMQYGHPCYKMPASDTPFVSPTIPPRKRVSFVDRPETIGSNQAIHFGSENKQPEPILEDDEVQKSTPKKRRWSAHFRTSKTDATTAEPNRSASAPHAGAEALSSKPSRFSRIGKSVSDFSTSLKQMAGRKRSREEPDEPDESERSAKMPRIDPKPPCLPPYVAHAPLSIRMFEDRSPRAPPCAQESQLPTPPATPDGKLADADLWPRPLLLTDPELRALFISLGRGPFAAERDDAAWTREERTTFGVYVRAADNKEWRMDLS